MARANGNGDIPRRVANLEKICQEILARVDKNQDLQIRTLRLLQAHMEDESERWKKNDERWMKNDERWMKNDERWKKADAQIDAMLKVLYRMMEER